jgi:hypothetical protein
MGQDGAWGGHPEVYAATWFYGIDITIYAQVYANTGGFFVFNGDLSWKCRRHVGDVSATCQFVADLDPICVSGPTFSRSRHMPNYFLLSGYAYLGRYEHYVFLR